MRRGLIVIFCFLLFQVTAADYQLFEENGKYGLKDQQGKVVITAAFEALGWANGNFSVIGETTGYKLNNHWGLINLKSQRITEPVYESLIPSGGDKIIATKKIDPITVKVGCIDLSGKSVIPVKYDGLKISGIYAIPMLKESNRFNFGIIDFSNNIVVPIKFRHIYPIGSLRFGVEDFEGKTALFSEFGKQLTGFSIDSISAFQQKYSVIYEGFSQGLIDRDGNIIVAPTYREIKYNDLEGGSARKVNQWRIQTIDNKILYTVEGDNLNQTGKFFRIDIANKVGLLDNQLQPIVPIRYNYLSDHQSTQLVAKQDGKYGIVRMDNSIVIPLQYDSMILDGKYARAEKKLLGKPAWMLYDTFGIKKTERSYEFIKSFNGQFFEVRNYGLSGIVNRYGKEIIHCVYDSIIQHDNELIAVQYHGQYGVIDYNENWLLPPQPFVIELVDKEHYLQYQDSMTFFKNFIGELIYFTDNKIEIQGNMLREFLIDGTEKVINFQGITVSRTAAPVTSDTQIVSSEKEGFRGIRRNDKFGFIDSKGRLRIANRYEGIGEFKDGLAAVKILGKWGYVNSEDKIVINPSYDYASSFNKSIAIVRKQKYGLIDKQGNTVLETRYDSVFEIGTGNFILLKDNLRGIANAAGKVLLEPRFDTLQDLGNGYVIISSNSKYGVLTIEGLSTIPMTYDHISYLAYADKYLVKVESPWVKLDFK